MFVDGDTEGFSDGAEEAVDGTDEGSWVIVLGCKEGNDDGSMDCSNDGNEEGSLVILEGSVDGSSDGIEETAEGIDDGSFV